MSAALVQAAPVLLVLGVCLLLSMPEKLRPARWFDR